VFRNWSIQVRQQTEKRLEEAMSKDYKPQGAHKALAPQWEKRTSTWGELEEWNAGDDWDDYQDDYRDDYQDSARDCIGWEEDMEKNGSPY
jgi:exonuclease 3'-5' domain-containing protein 1